MAAMRAGLMTAGVCLLLAGAASGAANDGMLKRPYTGTYMPLGSLYNAATEQPVGGLYAAADVIDRHRNLTATPGTNIRMVHGDTWSKKCDLFDISAEFSLSMSVGVYTLGLAGSAAFLTDTQTRRKEVRSSFLSEVTFETESLDVYAPGALDSVRPDAASVATHVVTGVVWGHRTVATFAHSYSSDIDIMDFEGSLEASLTYLIFTGTLGVGLRVGHDKRRADTSIRSTVYTDGVPASLPNTTDLEEVVRYVKEAYRESAAGEAPRGVPLAYYMTALEDVHPGSARLGDAIDAAVLKNAQELIDELDASDLLLSDLAAEDSRGNLLWQTRAAEYTAAFRAHRVALMEAMRQALIEATYGVDTSEIPALEDVVARHYRSEYTAPAVAGWEGGMRAAIGAWGQVADALAAAGVRVAAAARDVTRAVMNVDVDTSDVLLMVEGNGYDRRMVTQFAGYARRHLKDEEDPSQGHCTVEKVPPSMMPECHDTMQLTAVHFESFCTSLCPSRFCFTPATARATGVARACAASLVNGSCALQENEACWRRPALDGGAAAPAPLSALSEWCACPSTAVVRFESTGPETLVGLLGVPARPVIADVEARPSAALEQGIVVTLAPAAVPAKRYEIAVIWDCLSCSASTHEGVRTVTAPGDSATISIGGLRAGVQYRLEVTAVNDMGRSPPSAVWRDVLVREPLLNVRAESVAGADLAGDGAPRGFPGGVVEAMLPSWRVAGGDHIVVEVMVTAGTSFALHRVAFEEVVPPGAGRPPATIGCDNTTARDLVSLECYVPLAALAAPDPAAFGADRVFMVRGLDAAGTAFASGEVLWAAAGERACAVFEAADRITLCEGRIEQVDVEEGHADPLAQVAVVRIAAAAYERTAFKGWVVHVLGEGAPRAVRAPPGGVARVPGLTAGRRYQFTLAAIRAGGAPTPPTAPYPHTGYRVKDTMPIVTPRAPPTGSDPAAWRNRLPGWHMRGDGGSRTLPVRVRLTEPAASEVDRVVFTAADGRTSPCRFAENKELGGVDCAVWTEELNDGGVPGTFGERVAVTAYNRYGEILAEGNVTRQPLYARACAAWEPGTPLRCSGDLGPDRCVARCADCGIAGPAQPSGDACAPVECLSSQLFCPGDGCFDRDTSAADGGCAARCYGAALMRVAGEDACVPPCEPVPGVLVAPGATLLVACPAGQLQDGASVTITCPVDNDERHATHSATGVRASWALGAAFPTCRGCSARDDCNGRGLAAHPDAGGTRCVCTCPAGYAGDACETCAAYHALSGGRCERCTAGAFCNGNAHSASASNGQCHCRCKEGFAGATCDLCAADGTYPYCRT
eukprot:TRINITY_DN3758_c0_g5_i1.p1 TRINITY_DN3758_c0_g5~~TRINITY_DN3758_c0_g5_i1.p1  ORF type:complete len:1350 (+),score=346.24 TRINITY_DN3758_c0_g5_i1:83-4051(+)